MPITPTRRGEAGQWPAEVEIDVSLCSRCASPHPGITYYRFELGDHNYTHWSYCPATGEPLLLDMSRPGRRRKPDKFWVRFVGTGKRAQNAPDPRKPNGVDVVLPCPEGSPSCRVSLSRAPEIGVWKVRCTECSAEASCTAVGRTDDPRSLTMPCKRSPATKEEW